MASAWASWLSSWFAPAANQDALQQPRPPSDGDDFPSLDLMNFLQTDRTWRDREGRQVLLVAAKQFPANAVGQDRLFRYIQHTLEHKLEANAPFVVLWMHTCATYQDNCPSIQWLWGAYERLPEAFRSNLAVLHVLHCDAALWAASLGVLPLFSASLWHKICWSARVESLLDHVDKRASPSLWGAIPAYVHEHDAALEEQPLADYGVLALPKELASWAAAPNGPAAQL